MKKFFEVQWLQPSAASSASDLYIQSINYIFFLNIIIITLKKILSKAKCSKKYFVSNLEHLKKSLEH